MGQLKNEEKKKKGTCILLKKILITFFYMITTPLEPLRTASYRIYRLKSSQFQDTFICSDIYTQLSAEYFRSLSLIFEIKHTQMKENKKGSF